MTPDTFSHAGQARRNRWIEIGVCMILFVTYAYFHQGGGWNQNIRFDQVRAIVESGEFSVNEYYHYEIVDEGKTRSVRRSPLRKEGITFQNSDDIATYEGRIYPNKPPGTTLLALPAYFVIERVESWLGIDVDRWWPVTLNLYLITALSVGFLGALGGVVFYRTSCALFPNIAGGHHVAVTLFVFLGTLLLPYATVLFDHVPTAVFLLASFATILFAVPEDITPHGRILRLGAAGLFSGLAVVTNYAAVLVVACLIIYTFARVRPRHVGLFYLLGGIPTAAFLAYYHAKCFGSMFAMSYTYQNEAFVAGNNRLLGVFGLPDAGAAVSLILSARSGLLTTSPIIALAIIGFVLMWRIKQRRLELILFASIFLVYWLMNASFNKPHGGSSYGPRYLIPAIPFVALPLALVFHRLPRIATTVGVISVALVLYVTSINVQLPWHLQTLATHTIAAATSMPPPIGADERPVKSVFDVGVSTNRVGAYEFRHLVAFPDGSHEVKWNSFNLGETIAPDSFASVLPLVSLLVISSALLFRRQPPGKSRTAQPGPC